MLRSCLVGVCGALLAGCPSFPEPIHPPDAGGGPDVSEVDAPTAGPDLQLDTLKPDKLPLADAPLLKPDAPFVPDATGGLANGKPCVVPGHCQSGFCVDFVCCDAPCTGPCRACNLPGQVGTCTMVPAGADPHHECFKDYLNPCGNDGECDGNGACRKEPAGVPCAPGVCSTSIDAITGITSCDGNGACNQSEPDKPCKPFSCSKYTHKCYTSCSSYNEKTNCQGYFGCDDKKHTCYTSCKSDAQCNSDGQCKSGKCVED